MPSILLIEDDHDTAETLQAMLEVEGHEVFRAENGRRALDLLRRGVKVDLVLTDIVMPDMEGISTIQHLSEWRPDLPVVAMTARRDTPYLRAARAMGARETLYKPFGRQLLRDILQRVLGDALVRPDPSR
ncbi:MAG TPA: response regulator [Holophagaceae bacterium]